MGSLQADLTEKFKELMKKKDPQKAAQIIKKEYFATGPDRKNLKKSVRDFKKQYGYTLKEMTVKEETLKKRMKHAEACFDATLEMAKEEAMKEMLLDKTIEDQLKRANVVLKKNKFVSKFRSFHALMHLENTPEANQHNEKVVSLMLYNQGLIDRDQFVTLRKEQMKKIYKSGIEDFANAEADSKKEQLLKLIKNEVASLQETAKDAEKGAADVLNINENDPEKLKKAIRAIESSRVSLLRTGHTVYEFSDYHWGQNATEEEKHWANENMNNYGCGNDVKYRVITGMSNPYSSIIEPLELVEYSNTLSDHERMVLSRDEASAFSNYMHDAGTILYYDVAEQRKTKEKDFEKKLETAGMQGAEKKQYPNGFTVYKKDDDIVIMKNEMNSLVPLKMELKPAKPTELVKANFKAEMVNFCEQYTERNKGVRGSSPAYDDMQQDLKRLRTISKNFPTDANEGNLTQYKYAFETLKTKAEAYLRHKEDDFRKRNIEEPEGGYKDHSQLAKNSYERKRIELAESILKFTNGKLEALDLAGKYKATMARKEALFAEPNPAMNQPEIINAGGNVADKDENAKEAQKEKNPKDKIPTNIKELEKEQNKLEGKEKTKEKRTKSSGNIMEENNKLQLDPPAKKGF